MFAFFFFKNPFLLYLQKNIIGFVLFAGDLVCFPATFKNQKQNCRSHLQILRKMYLLCTKMNDMMILLLLLFYYYCYCYTGISNVHWHKHSHTHRIFSAWHWCAVTFYLLSLHSLFLVSLFEQYVAFFFNKFGILQWLRTARNDWCFLTGILCVSHLCKTC